jgi:dTDP-glucose 4,6-dehydratase
MSCFLVAGACGFIGSNFLRFLRTADPHARLVAADNLGFSANEANLADLHGAVELEVVDISDLNALEAVYRRQQPDYVINFAAESHNDRAILDPTAFMRANALGAQVALECSRRVGVRRHLHISTIEVYGELEAGAMAFHEGSPLNAKTPYSAAKAAGDQIVRAYMLTYPDMDIAMTHCANNYGPYQLPEKLVPLTITNVLRRKKVPLYGDGMQTRDWLHVNDHCSAIWAVLMREREDIPASAASDPQKLPIYDISARLEMKNAEIVRRILALLDADPDEWIEHVPDRPNHDRRYLIDPRKIENELGWKPSIDFAGGLSDTVRWYVDHTAWWEEVLSRKGDLQAHWT